jgi:hypothetical protein
LKNSGETVVDSAEGEFAGNSQAKAPNLDEPLERAQPAEEATPPKRENLSGKHTEMHDTKVVVRLFVL